MLELKTWQNRTFYETIKDETMHELVDTYMDHLTIEKGLSANSITAYGTDLSSYLNYLFDNGIED